MSQNSPEELSHVSHHDECEETIIFIHGLGAMHMEWKDVIPNIKNYHLLLIDSNGHGKSRHIKPFTIQAAADNVANTIRNHAHNGKAHVVGLSMGGFMTLELARRYPELVKSAFVSGAAPPEGMRKFFFSRPALMWPLDVVQMALPESVYWWTAEKQGLRRHEELYEHSKENRRWEVFRDIFVSIGMVKMEDVQGIKVRTLVVAGGKMDDVQTTKKMGPVLRDGGDDRSKVFVVQKAGHPWDMQFPELFAEGVVAWIEGTAIPAEFEEL